MNYYSPRRGGFATQTGATALIGTKGARVLENDELRAIAPSIFADGKHESRSERYTYIPTIEVIDGMRAHGFLPMFAKQGRSRIEGKEDFTKHLIRFRHQGADSRDKRIGNVYPEVVLINSHDGTSTYQVNAGLFRLICHNGMMTKESELTSVRVPHKGNVTDMVIEGSFTVLEASRQAMLTADNWAGIELNQDERQVMGEAARVIRFGDAEGEVNTPFTADQMMHARRRDDMGNDLWRTVNVIQENAIRGGMQARVVDVGGKARNVGTREIKGIDADVRINRALWMLGERMAELKRAA